MRCDCCATELPPSATTAICPPCFQALTVSDWGGYAWFGNGQLVCAAHNKRVPA